MNKFFKSEDFLATIIALALLNNIEHVSTTYYQLSRQVLPVFQIAGLTIDLNAIQAVLAILVLDFAVIAFVVRGKHTVAILYTVALFLVQLFYPVDTHESRLATWLATVLFAAMFSYTIYEFSKLYSGQNGARNKEPAARRTAAGPPQIATPAAVRRAVDSPLRHDKPLPPITNKSASNGHAIACSCGRNFKSKAAFNAHTTRPDGSPCTKATGKAIILNFQPISTKT